ncbi:DUF3616 domain-containing protein [Xanthobacter oligotrophicus]|uniref:DUF3616 domain-containing protein n=1 Tax=Xanthobacter oligotrophicus TaxID=2607286 RepID=UPI00165E662C|nr:DUF3616 domain-containing protein [Xanthobacter oligotrophicus]MCG5235909.1 DUF3616 domain-containing protein [Xanthobacter oligotrophicus]
MRVVASAGLLLLSAQIASADIVRAPQDWQVQPPPFRTEDGNDNKANAALSGAACVPSTNRCLVVNDEGRFAQFFEIDGTTIVPKEVIGLLPARDDTKKIKELDAEGVDYVAPRAAGAPGYFYVTGSHGLSRNGKKQPSRYHVLRFPVDPPTGRPTFPFDAETVAPQIKSATTLGPAIAKLPEIGQFAPKKLDENGVTVEGLAILGDEALFGLRGPCIAGNAFVVRAPVEALFSGAPLTAKASRLALGDNVGIRDLARVQDGVLILSGRSNDARGTAAFNCEQPGPAPIPDAQVWFWSGKDGDPARPLGTLPGVPKSDKAETLLVLGEDATHYRVLVWFDGIADGGATEFSIGK